MKVVATELPDVLVLEPTVHGDDRGHFFESYNRRVLAKSAGIDLEFVQENQSRSSRNVLRGLHYQIRQPQGKLVRVLNGSIFDVAVDMRASSPTFGRWVGIHLSAENQRTVWIPPGFAHGFLVLSDSADFLYKVTDYWAPGHERGLRWNDPDLAIDWPHSGTPILSPKDEAAPLFKDAERYA
jgi:dTDP-4-dehydrorhamnose 3,5-epimerase